MELDSILQIDILGILILTMILFNYKKTTKSDIRGSLFLTLLIITMFAQIFDITSSFVSGKTQWYFFVINYISITSIYLSNLFPTVLWLLIVVFELRKSKKEIYQLLKIIIPIIIVFALLITTSPLTNLMYKITSENIIIRNNIFEVVTILNVILTIVILMILIINKKYLSNKQFFVLTLFSIPSMLGGIFQSISGDYVTLWTGVSISCLILFMYIQTTLNDKDYITGLDNENILINSVNDLIKDKTIFTLIVYELENASYKDIDNLLTFTNTIKNVHPIGVVVSRINTNSFVVVTTSIDTQFTKKSFNIFEQSMSKKNIKQQYTLKSIVNNNDYKTYESLLKSVK